jgi:hypothetical protein
MAIEPAALFTRIVEILVDSHGESLLYHGVYASRMTLEEAATRYFDATLSRRVMLTGAVQLSVTHQVFGAMCRRGWSRGWEAATVARTPPAAIGGDASEDRPADFDEVEERLRKLPQELSRGSASATLSARHGPIILAALRGQAPVPEQMSAWDAVVTGPRRLRVLSAGPEFNRFCSVIINCVRTTNRPVAELLGLRRGLCPFDWLEVLSIQQVRALKRFLASVERSGGADTQANWSAAFETEPVPGFDSAAELWASDIGAALRLQAPRLVSIHRLADPPEPEQEAEFLETQEFIDELRLLQEEKVLTPAEVSLLNHLHGGGELEDYFARAEAKLLLAAFGKSVDALVDDIERRIDAWHAGDRLQ